ncbi:nSTAND1 domain-containing NTPase [Streptomyces sp. SudanB182_2057]|uniref:nSTAND1 domain-containing NTPase n=1 Tax=Streptomyces sp. SudanB182_2057 TaxID=3035281 RepID=UPI003F559418
MEFDSAAPGDATVVRILDGSGRPWGAGFLIGPRDILTSTHVVAKVLGVTPDEPELPESRLDVDFPLARPGHRIEARVVAWTPLGGDGSGDVAVLRLSAEPPANAPIARLVDDGASPDRRVRTFGFPAGYDDGVWSVGWLRGMQGADWFQYDTDPAAQHAIRQGFSGAPVWDTESGGVVGMVVAADQDAGIRTAYAIPTRTLRASWPMLGDASLAVSPFRALEPFQERDAALFHGREEPARRIVDRLGYAPATCLVGPSGSGKSSLLFAGVLPLLRAAGGHGRETVVLRPGRPGPNPLATLALALLPLLEPDLAETARLEARPRLERLLREGEMPAVVERLLARQGKDQLLLVVDQLEEALVGPAQTDLAPFAAALRYCLEPGSRLQVLLGLRADFLTTALGHPGLAPLLSGDRMFTLVAMDDEELRAAVERPLDRTGVTYEPGLVDRILADIGRDPGRLPLLQFTLTRLWERQERGVIGHAAYESLGRVDDALANYAERVWMVWLTEDEQREARALLTQLVHPAEGRAAPARRTVRRSELPSARWRIAQRLMSTRLVVPGEDHLPDDGPPEETVELAHETLLTQWSRLRDIVADDHEFRSWQEDLRRRAAHWERSGRSRHRLLRGADLRDARRWQRRRADELSAVDVQFIDVSARSTRRRRLAAASAGVAAVVVTASALAATLDQGGASGPGQAEAASRELWQRSVAASQGNGDKYAALLLALRAYRTHDSARTRALLGGMHDRYRDADLLIPLYSPDSDWDSRAAYGVSRRGEVVTSRSADGKGVVWQRDGSGFQRSTIGEDISVRALSPDGSLVVYAKGEGKRQGFLYDVRTHKKTKLETPAGTSRAFFSPEYGDYFFGLGMNTLLWSNLGQVLIWDTADGSLSRQLTLRGGAEVIGVSQDRVVTLSEEKTPVKGYASVRRRTYTLSLWNLRGSPPDRRKTHKFEQVEEDYTSGLHHALSPDLTRLAISRYRRTASDLWSTDVTVYDMTTGRTEWRETVTRTDQPYAVAVPDQGPPTLLYSNSVVTLSTRAVMSSRPDGWEVAPFAPEGTAVQKDRHIVALVVTGTGRTDPPALHEAEPLDASLPPSPDATGGEEDRLRAKEWAEDLCRVLGDEQLPKETEADLPTGTYRGKLCP